MEIKQTKAADTIQKMGDSLSSHQVISLMMDGALERIDQARVSLIEGKKKEQEILIQKIVGIIHGLRNLLNLEQGGEVASNLDMLYGYMIERVAPTNQINKTYENGNKGDALFEIKNLLVEVKSGWDEIHYPQTAVAS